MSLLLDARNLVYQYPYAESPTIFGLSLSVHSQEELVIVGAGESGKTTLARLFAGLLIPVSGEIRVFPMPGMYPKPAIVFQNPENQLVGTTVEEDIAFGPGNLALDPVVIRERVEEVVELCGLKELRTRQVQTLSGGEKQRVAIAAALALHPLCLIMDEAAAMLDEQAKTDLQMAISNVRKHYGTAIIYLTHSTQEALSAEKVAVLHNGAIAAVGAPHEVLWEPEQLLKWGLAAPPLFQAARVLCENGYLSCRAVRNCKELALEACRSLSTK